MKLKIIAARIAERAPYFPTAVELEALEKSGIELGEMYKRPALFQFGTLKIRCEPRREAILAVAEKYRRGLRMTPPKARMPTLARPADADARLAKLIEECGEVCCE